MQYSFAPFLAIGIAFVVLGINGQRTFLPIGIDRSEPRHGDQNETSLTVS